MRSRAASRVLVAGACACLAVLGSGCVSPEGSEAGSDAAAGPRAQSWGKERERLEQSRRELDASREVMRERMAERMGDARERVKSRRTEWNEQGRILAEAGRQGLTEQGQSLSERADADALVQQSQQKLADGREAMAAGQERIEERVAERVEYEPPEGIDEAIVCEGQRCTIDHRWSQGLSSRGTNLGREAVLVPRKGGGVVLVSVPEGGIADHFGLQSGDVVLSINGTKLDSLAAVNELRNSQAEEHAFVVEYERAGKVHVLEVRSR